MIESKTLVNCEFFFFFKDSPLGATINNVLLLLLELSLGVFYISLKSLGLCLSKKKENKISGSLTTLRLHIDGLLGLLNGVYGHRSKEPYSPQLLLDWDVGKRERERDKGATCQTWGSEKSK